MYKSQINISVAIFCTVALFSLSNRLCAQDAIFYNNGAIIYTDTFALLQINGGFENNSSASQNGDFQHEGKMWVTQNANLYPVLAGSVHLKNNSTLRGNGTYYVEKDWINDANFSAEASSVFLNGNNWQRIRGSNVTTFNNLTLQGFGDFQERKKTLDAIDAHISQTGILDLGDRELETIGQTMTVENTSVSSIIRQPIQTGGFVSSRPGGALVRYTYGKVPYLYPTGSSGSLIQRYRPVDITPADAYPNAYGVVFMNNDANDDGLSTTASSMPGVTNTYNPHFYHTVTRHSGDANADIAIHYDEPNDGVYAGIAFWDNEQRLWRDAMNVTSGPVTQFNFASKIRPDWGFVRKEDKHFVLYNEGSGLSEVPNIFTPNGDGLNDVLHIGNANISQFTLRIFNRWGNLLFEANSGNIDWDGNTLAGVEVPDGVYFYTLSAKTATDENISKNGFFTMIR